MKKAPAKTNSILPTRTKAQTKALHRKNIALAVGLATFAFTLAGTVFVWRYSHNQTAIPQGGTYEQTYEIQH